MITITMDDEEALALRNLLDIAVTHPTRGGMRVAVIAVPLDQKIMMAAQMAAQMAREPEQQDTKQVNGKAKQEQTDERAPA